MSEDGYTLIEVMVGLLMLTVGALGVLAATAGGKQLTLSGERNQVVITYVQREMERLSSLPYASLGLNARPAPEADATPGDPAPSTPAAYLTSCAATCAALRVVQDPTDRTSPPPVGVSASGEPLVTGGTEAPVSTVLLDGVQARVHRYVTSVGERCLSVGAASPVCPPGGQVKRVVVAVVLGGRRTDGVTKPVWASTLVTNPAVQALTVPS